jgi:hypothetical protein
VRTRVTFVRSEARGDGGGRLSDVAACEGPHTPSEEGITVVAREGRGEHLEMEDAGNGWGCVRDEPVRTTSADPNSGLVDRRVGDLGLECLR